MTILQGNRLTKLLGSWWELWFHYRYYILLISLLTMLLLPAFTRGSDDGVIWTVTRTMVLLSCINILRDQRPGLLLIVVLGLIATGSEWLSFFNVQSYYTQMVNFLLSGFFVVMISYEVFKQIIATKNINMHIIVGAFCGFMLIGLIASLIFSFLHLNNPESFTNVNPSIEGIEDLFYFSFITILTIGYGDIVPLTDEARSISLFFGLIGQFYLAVIMAVLVGKFIGQTER